MGEVVLVSKGAWQLEGLGFGRPKFPLKELVLWTLKAFGGRLVSKDDMGYSELVVLVQEYLRPKDPI